MNKTIHTLGLSAIIAAAAALNLGFSQSANAATTDHNSSRSNKTGSSADDGGGGAGGSIETLSDTMSEIDTLLSSMQENFAHANELQAQLTEQLAAITDASSAAAQGSEEQQAAIEEARKAFEEHVAPLLDPTVVEAVSLNFTKITYSYKSDDAVFDDTFTSSLDSLSSSLSACLSALDTVKSTSSELIATYDLKMAKK